MIPYLGDFVEDATVTLMFNTYTTDSPPSESCTITDFTASSVKVITSAGASITDGISVDIDYTGVIGVHRIVIDTSAHAFYAVGYDYFVQISGTTVNGATINAFVAHFSIQNRYITPSRVADQVWDEAINGHTTTGTYGLAAGGIGEAGVGYDFSTIFEYLNDFKGILGTTGATTLYDLINIDIKPTIEFLFTTLAGHGLHLLFSEPDRFNIAYTECKRKYENLPDDLKLIGDGLLSFFTSKLKF